jgi:signal transduction histidine kinase
MPKPWSGADDEPMRERGDDAEGRGPSPTGSDVASSGAAAGLVTISDVFTAVSLRLASAPDDELDVVIDEALGAIAVHEGADRAHITKYLEDGLFTNSHEWVAAGLPSHRPAVALRHIHEFPYSSGAVLRGDVWHAPDLDNEPDEAAPEKESFGAFGVKSVLQVPIHIGGEVVGCIGFNHMQTTRTWSQQAIDLIRRVGDAIGMVLARRDATIALRAARDEAERANTAKDQFLSRISHELRTPLNAVLGFAELLAIDETRPEQRVALDQILASGRHLLDLVEDVLDVSRMSSGSLAIAVSDVPLSVAVARAVGAVRPLCSERDVQIVVSPMAPRLTVRADPGRLHQVLVHLLTNAVVYNRPGGSVWVSGAHEENGVALQIRDDGIGMSATQLERVFEPFERAGAERTQVPGSGIGLTLSKMLLETMQGSIAIDSAVGLGTTVTVVMLSAHDL